MMSRLVRAHLLWPALVTLPAFCALIALGNWQWQRMHWKAALLRDLAAAQAAPPIALAALVRERGLERAFAAEPQPRHPALEGLRFRRVRLEGTFDHAHEMHVWQPRRSGPAWRIVTPIAVTLPGSAINRILIIRGIVPDALKSADARPGGQLKGPVTLTARIRLDQPNPWANAPDKQKNQWFARDLTAMAEHLRTASKAPVVVAPFFLEAEHALGTAAAPAPDLGALTLANRHLEYALTWWALAATLLAVFAAFAWARLKAVKINTAKL